MQFTVLVTIQGVIIMSKKELVTRVFNKLSAEDYTKNAIKQIIDASFEEIITMVSQDGECRLPGFVTFKKYLRKERQALHPVTRAPITVPAKQSIKVSISNDFKESIQD